MGQLVWAGYWFVEKHLIAHGPGGNPPSEWRETVAHGLLRITLCQHLWCLGLMGGVLVRQSGGCSGRARNEQRYKFRSQSSQVLMGAASHQTAGMEEGRYRGG